MAEAAAAAKKHWTESLFRLLGPGDPDRNPQARKTVCMVMAVVSCVSASGTRQKRSLFQKSFEEQDLYFFSDENAEPTIEICQKTTITVPASDEFRYLDTGAATPGVCAHEEETECYDFSHYPAGTYIDTAHVGMNDPPQATFANGDLQIVVESTASTTSFNVIREGQYPQAYMSGDNVINGCLEKASGKNAGLAVFNQDTSRWNDGQAGRLQTASTFQSLTFHTTNNAVDYLRISLTDFGDWNAFNVTDVKIHLTAYDESDSVLTERTWSVLDDSFLGSDNDACAPRKTLIVTSDNPNIKYAKLTFTSSDPTVLLPDPDMAITEICFPGAGTPRGTGQDDPHIVGFDGSEFEFRGKEGHVFNLISDEMFQLNVQLVESPVDTKTYMGVMGIVVPGSKIYISPWKLLLNGRPVDGISQTLPGKEGQIIPGDGHVTVVTKGWTVQVSTIRWKRGMVHLNFDVAINSRYVYNPHGVLGQTARFLVDGTKPKPKFAGWDNQEAEGIIEGHAEDYLVPDGVFGTEFVFNKFGVAVDHTKLAHRVSRIIVAKASDDKPKGE